MEQGSCLGVIDRIYLRRLCFVALDRGGEVCISTQCVQGKVRARRRIRVSQITAPDGGRGVPRALAGRMVTDAYERLRGRATWALWKYDESGSGALLERIFDDVGVPSDAEVRDIAGLCQAEIDQEGSAV